MVWKSGRVGRVMVLLVAAGSLTQMVDPYVTLVFSIGWIVFVVATAVALVTGRVGSDQGDTRRRWSY
jgi:hypothetical protein